MTDRNIRIQSAVESFLINHPEDYQRVTANIATNLGMLVFDFINTPQDITVGKISIPKAGRNQPNYYRSEYEGHRLASFVQDEKAKMQLWLPLKSVEEQYSKIYRAEIVAIKSSTLIEGWQAAQQKLIAIPRERQRQYNTPLFHKATDLLQRIGAIVASA